MIRRSDKILMETLLEKDLISREKLDIILKACDASGIDLIEALVSSGMYREQELLEILAAKLRLSCVSVKTLKINKAVLAKIPLKIASYYKFLPVDIKDRVLTIVVSVPLDIKTQDEIRTQLGLDIDMLLACRDEVMQGLKEHYGMAAGTFDKMAMGVKRAPETERKADEGKLEDIEKLAGDASVINLVNQIILEAYRKRATDIHIEPYRNGVGLRYRIDGILYEVPVHKEMVNYLSAIISRIKIMSNLNIVERRLPQDGRAVVKVQEQVLDLRISTIPTPYGESVVIRILPTQMLFSLEKLGMPKVDLQTFVSILDKPHGVVFVTGPTGSGKTTTLYTCLNKLNTKDRKIITVEDPIEYEMEGITQIQVVPEIGLDFALGLRSILRHDPDVIMVGEVRDLETAEIAIRVALTGHLVFSTLHTNDAASGVTRLVDIGVEPYLVASSVQAFIAQRLVRTICKDCAYEDTTVPQELKAMIAQESGSKDKDIKIFRGKGCANCNGTGFFGRTAIYEILVMDDMMRDLLLKKVSAERLKKVAVKRGMRTLRQGGWQKVIEGLTTPEEVLNITAEDTQVEIPRAEVAGSREETPEEYGNTPAGDPRRAYRRIDLNIPVKYKIFKTKDEMLSKKPAVEHVSTIMNVSGGGALFVADEVIPLGAIVDLKMALQDGENPIECLSRVVRISESRGGQEYFIAVCFLDISRADRNRLVDYINTEAGEF